MIGVGNSYRFSHINRMCNSIVQTRIMKIIESLRIQTYIQYMWGKQNLRPMDGWLEISPLYSRSAFLVILLYRYDVKSIRRTRYVRHLVALTMRRKSAEARYWVSYVILCVDNATFAIKCLHCTNPLRTEG